MAVSTGATVKSFVSAIDFLDQRDIDPNIYDQSRDRAFTDIMKIVNRTKPAKMFFYNNFVNNDVYEVALVGTGSTSASAGGTGSLVVLASNSNYLFPRVGDLIKTSNTSNAGKQALITSVTISGTTSATCVIKPVDGTAFTLTAGDQIQFGSNAFPEQSTAPTNRRYGLTKYYNNIQIFREVDEISDVQKVAKIEVNVGGDYHILPYQTVQKVIKLNGDISVQMLAGTASSYNNATNGGNLGTNTLFTNASPASTTPFLTSNNAFSSLAPVQTTGGLDWYVTNYGISDSATTLGVFTFVELDEIIDNLIANKAPNDMMVFMGSRAYRLISKFLKQLGSSSVDSRRLNVDGKDFDFNVEHLSYGGYEFDFVHVPIFDHPQLFSATLVADVNGSMYFVPKDQVDTVDNGRQPRMQIRYTPTPFMGSAANKSSNGMITEWRTGALAEIPTSSTMQLHTDWETAQGLECLAVKHFQKFRVI
jgi:hypothetical protein